MSNPLVPKASLAGALLVCGGALAAEPVPPVGDGTSALPAVVRVGIPVPTLRRIALAGSAGYGMTEGVATGDSAHHRGVGVAAISWAPIRELSLGLRLDGRVDVHPDDGMGSHAGAVGDPRLVARYGTRVSDNVFLGAEAVAWLPGQSAPSLVPGATTIDGKLLAAYASPAGLAVGALAGFRFDNSSRAARDADRYRLGDRLALGASDFHAVLVGVGATIPVAASTSLLAEVSGDLLVGSGAPTLGKSPLRASIGARHRLSSTLSVELLAEGTPSGRPSLAVGAPLVPVEPRVSVLAGLRFVLPGEAPATTLPATEKPEAEEKKPSTEAPAAAPQKGEVRLAITGEDGAPVPGATVEVTAGGQKYPVTVAADGSYVAADVPVGEARVTVTADGFDPTEQTIKVGTGAATAAVPLKLVASGPSGQLRGLVRSFSGKGLAAAIRVEPLGVEAKAAADGSFTIDVPPGDYEVVIRLEKFKEQRRKVHVDENGVTVINAELFEGR